jgi:hypothetical protein
MSTTIAAAPSKSMETVASETFGSIFSWFRPQGTKLPKTTAVLDVEYSNKKNPDGSTMVGQTTSYKKESGGSLIDSAVNSAENFLSRLSGSAINDPNPEGKKPEEMFKGRVTEYDEHWTNMNPKQGGKSKRRKSKRSKHTKRKKTKHYRLK